MSVDAAYGLDRGVSADTSRRNGSKSYRHHHRHQSATPLQHQHRMEGEPVRLIEIRSIETGRRHKGAIRWAEE
jgi:hypothetical protein